MNQKVRSVLLPLLLLSVSLTSFADIKSRSQYGPTEFSVAEKWTAIVAAYAPEIKAIDQAIALLDDAKIEQTIVIKGVKYQLGKYKNEPIVIFTTGVSVPNAAMTMQMALDYFPIDRVVMMGIAGGVNPDFQPGDIAIPERWYFHDESVYANPSAEKSGEFILPIYYEKSLERFLQRKQSDPHSPAYESFGFMHPDEMEVIKQGWDEPRQMPYFTATPELIELTKKAIARIEPIKMPSGHPINIAVGGNGVTGSVFLDNAQYRQWLQKVFNAQVAEMESAAVGQVCFVNEVDWIVIRSVSDLAGGQQGKNAENVFDAIASGTGAKLLLGLLDEIVTHQASSK